MADVIGIFQIDPRKLRANIAEIACRVAAYGIIDIANIKPRLIMGETLFVQLKSIECVVELATPSRRQPVT